jgi:hypothetical protein
MTGIQGSRGQLVVGCPDEQETELQRFIPTNLCILERNA